MKKVNNMSKEKAQRILFITVLILVFGVFFLSLALLGDKEPIDDPNIEDPDDEDPDDEDPVVTYETILVPFNGDKETIRKFYSLDQTEEDQLMSLIQNTPSSYTRSLGVSYSDDNQEFDVVASLSGKVKEVIDSPMYGKIVVLEHDDDIITEYRSLGNVSVAVGDEVEQGDVIGTSGTCDFDEAAENHLHFRISVDNEYIDPLKLFGKKTNNLGLEG